jgi:hypothetical protein
VITVCLGASPGEAERILAEESVNLLTLVDQEMEAVAPFHAMSTPTTYLIDAEGVIATSNVGYGSGTHDLLRSQILELIEDSNE